MAITTWQLIAATCCLLLETGSVFSKTYTANGQQQAYPVSGSNNPTASSYTSALNYERKSYGPHGSATDLAAPHPFNTAEASEVGNFPAIDFDNLDQQQMQKVYQSTVGRVIVPSRQASTVQATATTLGDLNTAAGHHHGHHHGKYYQYAEVPKKNTWKSGYKRGNHKHHIERHEHGKAGKHPHFKAKVKWADKKSKGKGIHLWEYNHHDKKHYHHGR